jgi:8-oxo-dGTP pyrophosphatase MutT (NUDIX family)
MPVAAPAAAPAPARVVGTVAMRPVAVGASPRPEDSPAPTATPSAPSAGRPRGTPRLEISAGGVVVRHGAGGARVLLIRDSYRNWGFPKGHLEAGETAAEAALREVREETGLGDLSLVGAIDTIEWEFRFRGRLVHKTCHFFLMETRHARTRPQRDEGITACRWLPLDEAVAAISYANARAVLEQARAMLAARGAIVATPERLPAAG